MAHHIVLHIAYDGSSYLGWQKTREGPSVEETLSRVLTIIFSENIILQAASRTDRGVHAEGQIVDFFVEKIPKSLDKIQVSLNQLLPFCIRCLNIYFAPFPEFHPTLSAIKKKYRYSISVGRVQLPRFRSTHWLIRKPLDFSLLLKAAGLLVGTYDFRGFCNQKENNLSFEFECIENKGNVEGDKLEPLVTTVRTVYSIDIIENTQYNELIIEITGNSFLYKMVRNIVGTLVCIAIGKLDITTIDIVLCSKKRTYAGITAPAHGLSLIEVIY